MQGSQKIVITGPRSVGKSTISKLLAKKLNLKCVESDKLMNTYLKKYGGLDKVIKSGTMNKHISKSPNMIREVLKKDNYVLDLAGGATSSRRYKKEASKIIASIKQYKPLLIFLLPYKNNKKSINKLFSREIKRKHFKNADKKDLFSKTREDYLKIKQNLNKLAKIVVYTNKKSSKRIVSEILSKIS